jgi:diguanylate cyclase (GGDEF)-like protein
MEQVLAGIVIIPGVVALLLFLLFTYLYEQSRTAFFRAWQLGWAAYCLHYALLTVRFYAPPSSVIFILSRLLLVAMAVCIAASTRLIRSEFHWHWSDIALGGGGVALTLWSYVLFLNGSPGSASRLLPQMRLGLGVAAVLLFSALRFYQQARKTDSLGFRLLSLALLLWAALFSVPRMHGVYEEILGSLGHFLGPVPQMLLGFAMLMVLFENERHAVQENTLAFSKLDGAHRLLTPKDLEPSILKILDRLLALAACPRGAIWISEPWRSVLPSVQRGMSKDFLQNLREQGIGEYLAEVAYRRAGSATVRNRSDEAEPLPATAGQFERLKDLLSNEEVSKLTAVSLQTRENHFGVILLGQSRLRSIRSSKLSMLSGLAMQIGMTLENYVVMHETQRRTKEYELLNQMGQAISSRLDKEELLRAIHRELSALFDTSVFYIAFEEGDEIRFELEVEQGKTLPKRSRKGANGITEYIMRTGQPLLVRSNLEDFRSRLGITFVPGRPAKSYCGVPIFLGGRAAGVMAAMNTERENVYEQRDLEVMQNAAGQVAVAIENARLFAEEQRRARYLEFLNNVSKTAISSEDAEQMLAEIVREIQKNFRFDHIGIGLLDYVSKEIEIRAEAGSTAKALGQRIPLGVGILGKVARTGEMALVSNLGGETHLLGILPDSRSVLCIPITYGETLLGVLNVESRAENAFSPQDLLLLNTLADLLATALHNAFVFQKLQQQSITDGLTGVKTRRFFWEALSTEWKRASRSGRPFSVVLIDLDKFKEVNDTHGHLEGDLVLARVGRLLELKCRQSNIVARYGGDEFVILMPETSAEQAQILSERLRLWVASDPMLADHQVTGSFGVGTYPVHGTTVEDLIRVADAGLYVSKRAGGNRVSISEESGESESAAVKRQLIAAYIEGFLHREHTGPEHVEELVGTLRKLCGSDESRVGLLKEGLETISRAAEARVMEATNHGEMVAQYAVAIGHDLGLTDNEIDDLAFAARVHDIGKIFLPERMLNRADPLSKEEQTLMQLHTGLGAQLVETIPKSQLMRDAVVSHHEAFDGSGYPDRLRGEAIPLWGRIIGLANAYVNLTTDWPNARAVTPEEAITELERYSGKKFDEQLVRLLAGHVRGGTKAAGV